MTEGGGGLGQSRGGLFILLSARVAVRGERAGTRGSARKVRRVAADQKEATLARGSAGELPAMDTCRGRRWRSTSEDHRRGDRECRKRSRRWHAHRDDDGEVEGDKSMLPDAILSARRFLETRQSFW